MLREQANLDAARKQFLADRLAYQTGTVGLVSVPEPAEPKKISPAVPMKAKISEKPTEHPAATNLSKNQTTSQQLQVSQPSHVQIKDVAPAAPVTQLSVPATQPAVPVTQPAATVIQPAAPVIQPAAPVTQSPISMTQFPATSGIPPPSGTTVGPIVASTPAAHIVGTETTNQRDSIQLQVTDPPAVQSEIAAPKPATTKANPPSSLVVPPSSTFTAPESAKFTEKPSEGELLSNSETINQTAAQQFPVMQPSAPQTNDVGPPPLAATTKAPSSVPPPTTIATPSTIPPALPQSAEEPKDSPSLTKNEEEKAAD